MTILNSSLIVFKIANSYHVLKPKSIKFKQLYYLDTLIHEKMEHSKILVEGFDVLKQLNEIELIKEEQGDWLVFSNEDSGYKSNSQVKPVINQISNELDHLRDKFILFLVNAFVIFLSLLIIILLIKYPTCCGAIIQCCCKKNKLSKSVRFNNRKQTVDIIDKRRRR